MVLRCLACGLAALICSAMFLNSIVRADSEAKGEVTAIPAESSAHGPAAGHGSGEHHDPTHSFAGAMQGNPMEFRSDGALFSLIVFLMLLAVLYGFAWKPISEGLAKREALIATQIADAKKASEEAVAKLKEYEVKLAAAHAESQELIAKARRDAESAGQRILTEAQAEAGRQRDRALADIETAKQTALSDIAGKTTDLAFSLARRVVGRELKSEDHKQLISDALNGLPSRN